ncbi:MAG: translocation/assembly module TamB domain-containing protein, partial [Bdellovibrionota bacterium]
DLAIGQGAQGTHIIAKSIGYLAVTPSPDGTNLVTNVDELEVVSPKIKESLKAIKANLDVQRNLVLISSLDVQRREAALHAAGKLVGSIDNIVDSRADVDVILRGPMRELSDFEKTLGEFEGEVLADAKIVGRLKDPAVQGKVELSKFVHGLWKLDKISASGSYSEGLLVLDSLNLNAGEGKISLKNKMEVQIPFKPEPAVFQLKLEGARLEDFGGELKRSVNNLRLRADGIINARLDFAENAGKVKLSAVTVRPELNVKDLELNNQVFKKKDRPYKRIFKVTPFQLTGNVLIKNGQLQVSSGKLAFATGTIDVAGTHTDDGFELTGVSPNINVGEEVGEISGLPIKGDGAIAVRVHGPDDGVLIDFDVKQQNASFLHFDFGKLDGKVVYDDKHDLILISGVSGQHGSANFNVDGKVDLTETDNIWLNATFGESAPDDVFGIFAHQLEKLTWIPRGMTGTISGTAKVSGKYTDGLNTLEIDSRLSGHNLSYKGEVVQELEAHAGVSKGVAFGHEIRGTKYQAPVTASIDYDLRTDEMKYVLDAQRGKLRGLDFLTVAEVPVDGFYSLHSEGKGRWETLASKTRFDVFDSFVRTRPLPPISLAYETSSEAAKFSGRLGSAASLNGQISHNPKLDSFADLSVQKGNFDFLLCMLSRSNCTDVALNFTATAEGKVTWKGWDWQSMSGSGLLQELLISKTGYNLRVQSPVKITAENGLMDSANGVLEGEDSHLAFHFRGRVNGTALDNSVKGSASLKLLEFITPLIEEARGRMRVELAVTGDVRNASFRGGINMEDGMIRVGGLDAPVDGLSAQISLANSHLSIDKLNGQLGGGDVSATGGMDLYLNRPPRFAIDLNLSNNRIKFPFVTYAEFANANLNFSGNAPPYLFSGEAHVKKVLMRNNFDISNGQKGLQNAKYLPEKVAGAKSFYEVRIRAIADSGIFVDNNLLNAEFKGEATLMNNFEFPQIVGRAELIRGKLLFRSNAFTLDYASIKVPNREVFDPQFQISGQSTVDIYRINLYAAGTVDRKKITLSSYPALPQEDIVSLLAFGYRGEDTRHVNGNDTSAITYSEVGSILMEQLQLSQNLQSKGLKVTVAPAVNDTEASLIKPNSAVTAAPKVYVQSQVVKNLEATLGGTVGAAQGGQSMDAKVEYRLSHRSSVRGIYEQSASGIDAGDTKNSYGADLRFRWEFK